MSKLKRPDGELGVAFTDTGKDPFIPEDTIGSVWLGKACDRSGKRLFRGTIDKRLLPEPIGNVIHVILFPFTAGQQTGISIQLSKKHHGKQEGG